MTPLLVLVALALAGLLALVVSAVERVLRDFFDRL